MRTEFTRQPSSNLNVLVPLAGNGRRFREAGYKEPKPLIPITRKRSGEGKPMIDWALSSLRPKCPHSLILIAKHEVFGQYQTDAVRISIGETTGGAACTVLMARELIDTNEPLLIGNCDQYLDWSVDAFLSWALGTDGNAIVTFQSDRNPKWSYVQTENGRITKVAEKDPISDEATVGVYFFRRGKDFVKAADAMMRAGDMTNGEFYLAPTFNYLKGPTYPYRIEADQMNGLGTPEDCERFSNS